MGWSDSQLRSELLNRSPEKFEEFVAFLWQKQGWATKLTRSSNDGGIDIIAKRSGIHTEKAAIQAKRYAPSNKVGRPDIQQYDTLRRQQPDIDFVIIATTSEFTRQATELAAQLNVKLVSGRELAETAVNVFSTKELNQIFDKSRSNSQEEATNPTESRETKTESPAKEDHNNQWKQSDPENLTVPQLAHSLSESLSAEHLSEPEILLANLYECYWNQRDEGYNGVAASSLILNFENADYLADYQMFVGLHGLEFSDKIHGKKAHETAKKYGWEIDKWEPDTSINYLGRRREDRDSNALLNLKPNGEIGRSFDPKFEARFTRTVVEGFFNTTVNDLESIDKFEFTEGGISATHHLRDYE